MATTTSAQPRKAATPCVTEKTIIRDRTNAIVFFGAWLAVAAPAAEFSHLCTFGSKQGIHPAQILNGRAARAALGNGDNPWGLLAPVAVTTDIRRRVWITDGGTASVHVFDRDGGAYREIRRAGDFALRQPSGIATDSQGRIYCTDTGLGGVAAFHADGDFDRWMVKPGSHVLEGPTALALSDDDRTVYVADPPRNVVLALNREGEVDGTIPMPAGFGEPTAISVIANQVYVLSSRLHKVAIFSPAGRPQGELAWSDTPFPTAFAYNPMRRWFLVADSRWMVIQSFDPDGRNLFSFGQRGDGVDQMQRVDSLYIDPRGLIYVVDSHHGKVLVFAETRY